MGDDGETFSSNFNKPSLQEEPIGQPSIQGDKLNGGELQCEFVPQSGDLKLSTFDSEGRGGLAELGTREADEAVQGGVHESGVMHAADDVEDKIGAEEVVVVGGGGEGPVLEAQVDVSTERAGGENSDVRGVDKKATNEKAHTEDLAEQGFEVAPAEEVKTVVDTLDFKDDATASDTEKNGSDVGIIVGRRDDTVIDEAVATVEEENPITEPDHLHSITEGSIDVDEDPKMVVKPVEPSRVMTGAEKAPESAETNVKLGAEAFMEVTQESNAENVPGGLQFTRYECPDLAKEGMNPMGVIIGKEGLVADTEIDDLKEKLEISGPSDLQCDGQESVIVVNSEANKERLPGGIPISDAVLEEGKESETGAINVGNVEPIFKPDDVDFVQQDDEDKGMLAEEESVVEDTGRETETGVGEEQIGKVVQIEDVEAGDVQSIPNTDDVPGDGKDEKIIAEEQPALAVSEMETNTNAVEEPRALGLEQEKEAETKTFQVGDVESILNIDDTKPISLDDEKDGETIAEEESSLGSMEMETQRGVVEERRLLGLEKGKEAETEEVDSVESFHKIEKGKEPETEEVDNVEIFRKIEMGKEAESETAEVDNVENFHKIDDVKYVTQHEGDEEMLAGEGSALGDTEMETETALGDTEMETETDVGESSRIVGVKQKRGRNSKTLSKAQKIMEEDVCFICFDGGDLVLCDRRGCPKAYHPSCVNRDEAFFKSKGRWNCGWHICNICKKAAHYMCYTCPYSLCKGCAKDAVILCVRGNKGFCETCMRTVKLIENSSEGSNDIDFDDKSSWEFLFKDYYTDLKSKLSLTSAEIDKAKNPWKGSDVSIAKEESPEALAENKDGGGSGNENLARNSEGGKPKRKKVKKRSRSLAEEEESAGAGISSPGSEEWASKELLEFVMHMKDGDKSVLSQFDVQALLLEYIKRNKLRDPRRKSQIICDSRLENLFGKPRVGHFEMLKLLESHFLLKEGAHTDDVQGSVVDTEVNQLEVDENDDTVTKGMKEKKRKIRRKGDKGPLSNRYDYAAIDTHNISLIYLRRKLMEDILEDVGDFQHKVAGTFVRIRISGNTQKQDLYRLVQVVGTSKAAEPYKVGKRTTDVMLEILNLNKTEVVSIDTISNQEFTEEECKRLRQSIKCGLLNRMTVGDILDKAMELQAARVNDWLESEILRLSHLRDRASDMGRRKELRECVEKLQILKTPEERLRRLEEIPRIHVDPKMDPNNQSEEDDDSETDDNRQEGFLRTNSSGIARRGRVPISPGSEFSPKDSWTGGGISSKNWESNKNVFSKNLPISVEDASRNMANSNNSWNQGREKAESKANLSSSTRPENVGSNSNSMARSEALSGGTLVNSSVSLPAKQVENVVKINETQKMWHYQDPSGKVQGPFSVTQLRKWSNTGYFPNDLRIWKTGEKQDECILLTDALAGRFEKESSGESKLPAAVALDTAHGFSDHYMKTSETPLQLSREETFAERTNIEQNRGLQTLQMGALKGLMAPVEVSKLSTDKWTRSDLSNLPSPTPERSSAAGEQVRDLLGGTSFPEGIQSPASALLQHHGSGVSSVNASVLNPGEQLINGHENEVTSISSANASQAASLTAIGDARAVEDHGHHLRAQGNTIHPVQLISGQNSHIETHGWGGPPAQKAESNALTPVPAHQQAYNHWGVITPPAQNPVANFPNSGASALPQPEFWGPMAQNNQPNMQTPAMTNVAWGTGLGETNSSASALRPENSNAGWAPMQANPNLGWVAPAPGPTNVNWGSTVQGPAPGNANSGWVMNTGDAGSSVQGQMPSNVNPGWAAPPVHSGAQGIGGANIMVQPFPGAGATQPVFAPHVQGGPSGNTNQGWGAPPGNQGTWGSDKYQSGGNFSGPRDKGPQVGDSGYGAGRPWNRQSSFGRRGADLRNAPRGRLCPYNTHGKCRKGNRCNYIHS